MVKLQCNDFFINLRLGRIEGMSSHVIHGRAVVGTVEQSLYNHASVQNVTDLRDTPAVLKVASSDANDTNTAGTGARKVRVDGLDANLAEISEIFNLNGQTEVTGTTVFSAVNSVTVTEAGSGEVNAGDIWVGSGTFTAGVPATKYSACNLGTNFGQAGIYTVPAGKQALLDNVIARVADTGKFVIGKIIKGNDVPEETIDYLDLAPGVVTYKGHHAFAAGEYIRVQAATNATTSAVSIEAVLILVNV